jgi:FKBP-type peptidyl-prolyl cis-trans isomerase
MRSNWIALGLGILLLATQANAEEIQALDSQTDKISYGMGVDMMRNFKRLGIQFNLETLIKGMKDELSKKKLLMSEQELRLIMNTHQSNLMQRQAEITRIAAEANKNAGGKFLAENKKREGVVTLESGLQYTVIKVGDGAKPVETDIIECNYRGTLINGKEFANSYDTKSSAFFPVEKVIPGWKEALKLMPVGSKWQLFVPPQLAYGATGAGRDIGPNETLIFEIELLSIASSK